MEMAFYHSGAIARDGLYQLAALHCITGGLQRLLERSFRFCLVSFLGHGFFFY